MEFTSQNRHDLVESIVEEMIQLKRAIHVSSIPCPGGAISSSHLMLVFLVERLQPTSVKELAQDMQMTAGAVTQLFDSIDQSWFTRTTDPTDRRIKQIVLSDKGLEIVSHIRAKRSEMAQQMAKQFSDAELQTIYRFMVSATEQLRAAYQVKSTDKKG